MSTKGKTETDNTKMFNKLFDELGGCDEEDQKQKIVEMNGLVDYMNEDECKSVFTIELFNKIDKMIGEERINLKAAILLLKHIGYCKKLKNFRCYSSFHSLLPKRIEEMIIKEEEKKGEKNEMLLIDLCECYIMTNQCIIPDKLIAICLPCLLKAASHKLENEETRNEVEMVLFSLSLIETTMRVNTDIYLNEIIEIIEYHKEHRNLTRLGYQSAWKFMILRLQREGEFEDVILNEFHFVKEATRELDELRECVNWKRKGGKEKEARRSEAKEVSVIMEWLRMVMAYFRERLFLDEEHIELIRCIVALCRAAREHEKEIIIVCILVFKTAAQTKTVCVDYLTKSGAANVVLEEIQQATLKHDIAHNCLRFFLTISKILKRKMVDEMEKTKRKVMKMEISEKMEEEGHEDFIISFQKKFGFLNRNCYPSLSLIASDYFVNV